MSAHPRHRRRACAAALSMPTLRMDIDRTRAGQVGLTAQNVAQSVLVSLSGSFQTAPNFWLNPRNGVTYQVAVQAPQYRMDQPGGPDGGAGDLPAGPAAAGQPGAGAPGSAARRGEPLERGSRSSTSTPAPRAATWAPWPRTPTACSRTSGAACPGAPRSRCAGQVATMRASFLGLGVGLAGRHRPGLPADRGQLPVLAGPLHHHHRPARGPGRHLLVPAADPHHPERALA